MTNTSQLPIYDYALLVLLVNKMFHDWIRASNNTEIVKLLCQPSTKNQNAKRNNKQKNKHTHASEHDQLEFLLINSTKISLII